MEPIIRKMKKPASRVRVYTILRGESRTHQSHAAACDINNIIRKFDNTGVLPPPRSEARYADVTSLQGDITELHQASMENINKADAFLRDRSEEQKQTDKHKQLDMENEIARLNQELFDAKNPPPTP